MNKESKLNLNAGDYAISHCDSDKTYNGLEVHKMLCDAYIAGNNDTLESEDEKIRKRISQALHGDVLDFDEIIQADAWLEKQGEQKFEMKSAEESLGIDSDTYNKIVDECIFGEQKTKENKGNIGGISPDWSEEDERLCQCLIEDQEEALDKVSNNKYGHSEIISDLKEMYHERIDWLKSLQDRVGCEANCTTTKEWSEEDEHRIKDTIYFLDTAKKHYASTEELDACIDWLKSLRPQSQWKPSELQLGCLSDAIEHYNSLGYPASKLKELLDDLKKLKEGKV